MVYDGNSPQQTAGRTLGRYQIVKRIGRGGMADVWLCTDPRLNRQVAIKTLPAHDPQDVEFTHKFKIEAQAAAALNHPHIVSVHDYGEHRLPDGQVITYIVMPYISGGSLADRIETLLNTRTGMVVEEAITYLSQAASAIDYAHQQGLIHRDIKPGNMLLRETGWLLLSDFGIARLLSNSTEEMPSGTGFGTPEYMAPEQARGRGVAASDIYSLAVIAFQLFTGRLPFIAETTYTLTMQHILAPPPSPREVNPRLPVPLERAILHGLEKEPTRRPNSAQAFFAEIMQAYPNLIPRFAPPISAPLPAPGPQQPSQPLSGPPQQPSRPLSGSRQPSQPLSGPPQQSSRPLSGPPQPARPLARSEAATQSQPFIAHRGPLITRRTALAGGGIAALLLAGGSAGIWYLTHPSASSPEHKTRTTATPKPTATPNPNAPDLTIRDQHISAVSALAWSPQGNKLVSVADNDFAYIWNVEQMQTNADPQPLAKQQFNDGHSLFPSWSPDGKILALANTGEQPIFDLTKVTLDLYTSDFSSRFPGFTQPITADGLFIMKGLAWAQKKYLCSVSTIANGNLFGHFYLWALDPSKSTTTIKALTLNQSLGGDTNTDVPLLHASPDGQKMAIAAFGGILIGIVGVNNGTPTWQDAPGFLPLPKGQTSESVSNVAWSPDSSMIVGYYNSSATTIGIWNIAKGTQQYPLTTTTQTQITAIAWGNHNLSSLISTGTSDGQIQLWDPQHFDKPIATLSSDIKQPVLALEWSPDYKWLAASYKDNFSTIHIWKMQGRSFPAI